MIENNALLQHRILFLSEPVSEESANRLVAQLLLLDADNHKEPIDLYVNSPGGSVTYGIAIIDAIQCIEVPVRTVCIGRAASMGAWILAAGMKGSRVATPNAEVMIHQMARDMSGQTADIQVQAKHMLRLQNRMVEMLAGWTGQNPERIQSDMDRDYYMTAEEAKDYGIIDEILEPFADKR